MRGEFNAGLTVVVVDLAAIVWVVMAVVSDARRCYWCGHRDRRKGGFCSQCSSKRTQMPSKEHVELMRRIEAGPRKTVRTVTTILAVLVFGLFGLCIARLFFGLRI